ncbi:MAG: thioredoxin-disulfide reductase [Candidatus Omnitrophica bacterium]|nr:thioredoxin-disulfide reductase [Candidatus Omnitrophota bacterium]
MNKLPEGVRDIIIIGGGPAGLTAGLYAARAGMDVLLVESMSVIGQLTMTETVENYPGIEKIGGFELVSAFKKQAQSFGLENMMGTVKGVEAGQKQGLPLWKVHDENAVHEALSIIVTSGARPKKLEVAGETEFLGKGVSYCATCDGAFFREKDIVVVGGGDAAVEEALFLTKFGKKVTLVHRRNRLRAARVLQQRALNNDKMDFVWESVVERINGKDAVESITLKNRSTGKNSELPCNGVFIFVGWHPNTEFLGDKVDMNDRGAITVDSNMRTSRDGIFAAGDCTSKLLHQVVTACGDGATAAYASQQYVEELKGVAYK